MSDSIAQAHTGVSLSQSIQTTAMCLAPHLNGSPHWLRRLKRKNTRKGIVMFLLVSFMTGLIRLGGWLLTKDLILNDSGHPSYAHHKP